MKQRKYLRADLNQVARGFFLGWGGDGSKLRRLLAKEFSKQDCEYIDPVQTQGLPEHFIVSSPYSIQLEKIFEDVLKTMTVDNPLINKLYKPTEFYLSYTKG